MTEATQQATPLAERIRAAVADDDLQLPPLPELAIKLGKLLEDETADARQVAALIKNDPAVTAALLRIANSAAFGGLRQIADLNQAVARLGLKRIRSLVTAMQVKGLFHGAAEEKQRLLHKLWDHSVCSAMCASRLAQRQDHDAEEAFLAGLLYDIGRLLVLKAVDDLELANAEVPITTAVLDELMEVLHAELGHRLLVSWKLPQPICESALYHENRDDEAQGVVLLVQAADAVSRKLGFHIHPDTELNLEEDPAIEELELRDIELATLMVDLEDEIEQLRRML